MRVGAAFRRLALRPRAELEEVFLAGARPRFEDLAGREFLGYNPPALLQLIGIGKFVKGFQGLGAADPPRLPARADALGWGYNRAVKRSPIEQPWDLARPADDRGRFGFYQVRPVDPAARDGRYPQALLLDYGSGGNPALDPSRIIRDYLVHVPMGGEDLYLGKAYLTLGPVRKFSNFFLLARV